MAKSIDKSPVRRTRKNDPPPKTGGAVDLALEALASRQAPRGAAHVLIENQGRLVGWQIASERAGFALKLLTAMVGVFAALVVAAVLFSASRYQGLTIQPFSVPPDMEARGLNGSAVATRVLDKLTALQARSESVRAAHSYANSWSDTVEVQIPQIGVSAGELWKFLRSWLGNEVKITGEIVRIGPSLQITARAGGASAALIEGPDLELEALLDRAAEGLFAETQPYRYGVFLRRSGRLDEAVTTFQTLARTGQSGELKWALTGWAETLQAQGRLAEAAAKAEGAIALDPKFGPAYDVLAAVEYAQGREEAVYHNHRMAARLIARGEDLDVHRVEMLALEHAARVAYMEHDEQRLIDLLGEAIANPAGIARGLQLVQAQAMARLHDVTGARRHLRGYAPPPEEGLIGAASRMAEVEMYIAQKLQDWPAVVRAIERQPDGEGAAYYARFLSNARARAGDLEGAETASRVLSPDSYWGAVARARLAARRRDVGGSEHWFRRAVALAPSLADAEFEWGLARLERGDARGAIGPLREAARKAPRWAEPLKSLGDALALNGDARGAVRQYRAAEERAPRWGGLYLAWGRSLDSLGDTREAQAKYRQAAALDLNAAERTEIDRRILPAYRP